MNNVYLNNFWAKIKAYAQDNRKKVLYRKKLINLLTIDEAEKVYTSYVSKNLYETVTDFRTKKQTKRRVSFFKLKLNIRMKVSNDQIIYAVPRLKEVEY